MFQSGCVMKALLVIACLFSISSLPALAQPGSGGGGRGVNTPSRPRVLTPDVTTNTTIFLSGKVVIADGGVLTESVSIQTVCKGRRHTETHTDSHGGFSFQFGGRFGSSTNIDFDADTGSRNTSGGRSD